MTGPNYTPCEFTDFAKAEKEADLAAGDTGLPMAVVEDFAVTRYSDELGTEIGRLFVMPLADAEKYTGENEAEIQYTSIPAAEA